MLALRESWFELDNVQHLIHSMRAFGEDTPEIQLEMDRQQDDVDAKRERIETAMATIASWN